MYDEIIFIVHPIYAEIFELYRLTESEKKDPRLKKLIAIRIKKTLDEYGRAIKEYAKKENTIVILAEPVYSNRFGEKQKKDALGRKTLERFYDFCKSQLGDRFFRTTSDLTEGSKFLEEKFYSKLAGQVKIRSFGQYGEACVNNYSERLKKEITRRGKIVKEHGVLHKKTIHYDKASSHTDLRRRFPKSVRGITSLHCLR